MNGQYDIFISHSDLDVEIARDLKKRLKASGFDCFLAHDDIPVSKRSNDFIYNAIQRSKIVLFLMTSKAVASDWVKIEAGAAWVLNKHMVTLLSDIQKEQMIDLLRDFQYLPYKTPEEIDLAINAISAFSDLTAFWKFFLSGKKPEEKVYVALSAKIGLDFAEGRATQKRGHTILVSYNEFNAALNLQKIELLRDNLQIVHGGVIVGPTNNDIEFPEFDRTKNLIVLGSKHANQLCKQIMEHESLNNPPYQFKTREDKYGEKEKYIDVSKIEYPKKDEIIENLDVELPVLTKDYGLLLRTNNPFDEEKRNKVLILGGNHGYGTEAALQFISDPKRIKDLRDQVQDNDFEALFRAEFRDKKLVNIKIVRIKLFDEKRKEWLLPERIYE